MHIVRASRGNSKFICGTLVCEVRGNEGMGLLLRQCFSERLFSSCCCCGGGHLQRLLNTFHTVEEGPQRTHNLARVAQNLGSVQHFEVRSNDNGGHGGRGGIQHRIVIHGDSINAEFAMHG
jgi:hypothetical protein